MRKIICVLFTVLLCSCSFRSDYYTLYVDDYRFTVGYDDTEYLKFAFDLEIKKELEAHEIIEDVKIKSFDKLFCTVNIENIKDKTIDSKDGIISKLVLYTADIGDREYRINKIKLDKSVKSDCSKLKGKLIEKNGYACVIEKVSKNKLNVVELHGDILNIDQDVLDHIVIYLED